MYFRKLYMHGFKSFAEPVTIDFDEGVTCIVGPNGSGKSNISDAIRWVLGEQSPKALRGGKMDEVIFAGTASRKSRGMAEVTLVIDNTQHILPIDYNEVAITRRMYRSGESEYLINNNHCRLKDIRELIMDTGIGVDGYSIIGQGKIADIVSNKPESRREIFEEAAGIVMYRTKKAEVERKLAASNANLERVNDIVSELEGRIGTLKADSEKATEYLALRERYKELEINITLKNVESLELKMEYLKDDIAEAAASLEDLREEKAALDRAGAENRARSESLEALTAETSARLMEAVEELNELTNRSEVNREKLASIDSNVQRLLRELAVLAEKEERERESEAQLCEERDKLVAELNSQNDVLRETLVRYGEMTKRLAEAAGEIDRKKNDIFELHSLAQSKRAEAVSLRSLKENLDGRRTRLAAEGEGAEAERTAAEAERAKTEAERDALLRRREEKRGEAQRLTEAYNGSLMTERQLSRSLEELRIAIGQLNGRKRTIEEMEANYEGYNQAVRYLMKAKLPGVEGVVAELMETPAGYETAIETALGAALQNIVCADNRSAKNAVEMLKRNRAGRLTFLPVASIKGGGRKDARLERSAGFRGYGCECIQFEERYRNIFEYLLGRTVVVDTMENAIAMSEGNESGFRFVTLEGEIINASGAITGGRYKNQTANLLERKAEVTRLAAELAEKSGERDAAEKKLARTREELEETQRRITRVSEEAKQLEMDLLMSQNRLDAAESALADLAGAADRRQAELLRIEEESARSEEMIAALIAEAEQAEKNAEACGAEAERQTEEYNRRKQALDGVNEEIVKARMAVNVCEEQKNSAESMVARVRQTLSELRNEAESKESERAALLGRREEITADHGDFGELVAEKTAAKERLEAYAAELAEERAAVTAALGESAAARSALDERTAAVSDSKYNAEIRLAKDETQLEHYKDKLWEEFEISYVQAIEFKKKDFAFHAAMREVREIRERIKALGEVNVGAIKEYAQVGERYEFLTAQRRDILQATESLSGVIGDMDKTIKAKFKESFDGIMGNFEQIFGELFGGGHAELRLEDESNPLESGIEIIAQPPGKKLQNINLMSGGEKTMTAIALMFAVLKTKPTPFCILDEVEAALDDVNIDRFANYLKKFDGIQFALVTHQRTTMEHANALYGVTMPEQGVSRLLSLRLGDPFEI